jgi:hypothetical protein
MMLTVEALFVEIHGLQRPDLERWISNAWVRPDGDPEHYLFREIDVARIRLIMELRENLEIEEQALPTVLSLHSKQPFHPRYGKDCWRNWTAASGGELVRTPTFYVYLSHSDFVMAPGSRRRV